MENVMKHSVVVSILKCTLFFGSFTANANDSDECVFRFVHPASRITLSDGKERDVPKSEFGLARINRKNKFCLYEYWYDGVHFRPRSINQFDPRIGESKSWMRSAAGFDGDRYWLALFSSNEVDKENRRTATYIVLNRTPSSSQVEQNLRDRAAGPYSSFWYDHAILHRLSDDLSLKSLDKGSLLSQLRKCSDCVALDDGRYVIHPGKLNASERQEDLPFCYTLRLSDGTCGVESCDVKWRGTGGTQWNFAVPQKFTIEHVDNALRDKTNYSWATYQGPATRVVERE